MEFGLLLHTRHLIRGDRGASGRTELDAFWATAERAETDGYDHLWTGDSPRISQLDRAHADCLTIMAGLAARTGKIRIGAVPLIAALRNPVLLAHSLATLDVISDGRLLVGVSAAPQYKYAEREFAACGVPFAERAGRLEESIGVMRRLWTEESFSFQGKYYSWPEIGIQPRPARQSIPIWIAAGDNENALRRAALLGDGWFTVAPTLETYLARRQKIDRFARAAGRDLGNFSSALFATFHLSAGAGAEEEGWTLAERYFRQPRAQLKHLSPFFGTPEDSAKKLQGYVDAGLTAVVARFVAADVAGQTRMLLNEVKPRLKMPVRG
ncbi:MAG TPA: LLM class flavin-dependent oxidoreductase [Candidatus Binatia bacterium]